MEAVPPLTVIGLPMVAVPFLNCTVPVAFEGVKVAVRPIDEPNAARLAGVVVSAVVTICVG